MSSDQLRQVVLVNGDPVLAEALRAAPGLQGVELVLAGGVEELIAALRASAAAVALGVKLGAQDPVDIMRAVADHGSCVPLVLFGDLHRRLMRSVQQLAGRLGLVRVVSLPGPADAGRLARILLRTLRQDSSLRAEELRRALDEHQLTLEYQPKFQCRDRSLVCVEALVRWNHLDLGLLLPGRFLPLAAAANLLTEVTDFTLTEAIHQVALWRERGIETSVSVNLAAALLRDSGFPERLMLALRQFDVPPSRLTLEVQETARLMDRELCLDAFTRLRLTGVGLALDDFGTGYSSLTELYRMPFTELKLDRTIVTDAASLDEAAVFMRAITRLAHDLSVGVCAEGVETQAELECVTAAGCDFVQGSLLAEPCGPADLGRLLASDARDPGGPRQRLRPRLGVV